MRIQKLREILIAGSLSAYLSLMAGCSGTPDLHFVLESSPSIHRSFEKTFQQWPQKEIYSSSPTPADRSLASTAPSYNNPPNTQQQETLVARRAYLKSQLEYLERIYKDLEIRAAENIKKYGGRKESLSDLEQALSGLRSEVINPTLEAKTEYESIKKEYESK